MIYFEGLDSIIECAYLSESLTEKTGLPGTVFVNPENIKYLIGRTVVISSTDYPKDNVKTLLDNQCKVISRVFLDMEGVNYQPYITRLNFFIMWNGRSLEDISDITWEDDICSFNLKDYILYFPKVKVQKDDARVCDKNGNLTSIGWALHQVGVNLDNKTPFQDLDIIKTRKFEV